MWCRREEGREKRRANTSSPRTEMSRTRAVLFTGWRLTETDEFACRERPMSLTAELGKFCQCTGENWRASRRKKKTSLTSLLLLSQQVCRYKRGAFCVWRKQSSSLHWRAVFKASSVPDALIQLYRTPPPHSGIHTFSVRISYQAEQSWRLFDFRFKVLLFQQSLKSF